MGAWYICQCPPGRRKKTVLVKGKRLTEGKWFKQLQELGSLELEACSEASHVETRRELILQSKS